jgi:hypothetical protein
MNQMVQQHFVLMLHVPVADNAAITLIAVNHTEDFTL